MALQSITLTVGAARDSDNNNKNYVSGQDVYIKKTNGTLANIYRDLAGTSQIAQDGLSNVTNSNGQFTFFVEAGDYNAEYAGQVTPITVVGPDYFNNRIDETVNQIILDLSTSRGFRVRGTFAAGFTYELPNDVGLDASGNAWVYTDVDALPFTVPAATSPSFPTYTQVTFNQASNISYTENGNVENALRKRAGYYTLAEAQALTLEIGQSVFITDYDDAKYTCVDVSDVGGWYLAGSTSKLRLQLNVAVVRPNLKWFGVLQDGTDQTTTVQDAANWLFDNNYHECTMPRGDTRTGQVFYPCAAATADAGFRVYGCGVGITRILGTASSPVTLKRRSGSGDALRFGMYHLTVVASGGQHDHGIYSPDGMAYCELDDLHVLGFKNNLRFPANTYINRFTRLLLSGAPEVGFNMAGGSGTTNFFDNIFVFGATVSAYDLTGAYSTIGSLAADNCSGTQVYRFNFFSGTASSIGSESNDVQSVLNVLNSNLSVDYLLSFHNQMDNTTGKGRVLVGSGSTVDLDRYVVTQATQFDATFSPIDMLDGKVKVGQSSWNLVSFTGEPDGTTDTEGYIISSDDSTGIAVSNDGTRRAYIGMDRGRTRFSESDPRINGTLAVPKAIFMDAVGQPRFDSDGNDYRFGRPARVGDWFMESDPLTNRIAAMVITETGSDLNACKWKNVIFEQKGTTAERPSSPRTGEHYYDTTLGRPIWYSALNSRWEFADGTAA